MMFKRDIFQELVNWKQRPNRKPLLLMGARQIGKTTILKEFGQHEYDDLAYFNLEKRADLHELFKENKDPVKILDVLNLNLEFYIKEDKSLLVLDEIQECKDAITTLKYFQEELPHIHIIGAGSLLGLSIGNKTSFPVGKVEFLDMFPLSFSEYLMTADKKLHRAYHHYLNIQKIENIPSSFFNPILNLFKQYLLLAGMPESALQFQNNRNVTEARQIQEQIIRAYQLDFVKHAKSSTSLKIQQVWNSLPSQLAKENKKFIFKLIKTGARAREYEEAIQWLIQAGLVYKVSRIEKPGIPIKAYEDLGAFKLYTFETGLLMYLADLDTTKYLMGDQLFSEFKGAIAENYVAQSLKKIYRRSPHYWTSDGIAKVDFIIQHQGDIIPIEVKSGQSTKAKSLRAYQEKYNPKWRIRISTLNLQQTGDFLNVPIFYAEYINVFIDKMAIIT